MGLSCDHFFPTEIDMSSMPPMIDALIDGITTFLLQMKCDRRNLLQLEQKQQEDHTSDRVNFSAKPNDTYEEYVSPEVTAPTRSLLRASCKKKLSVLNGTLHEWKSLS
jgi:hypothetical protein